MKTMKMKRWLSVILCALLCVGLMPTMAFAEEAAVSVWDGTTIAAAYESGDGTEGNPYEIATADQFAYFAAQINQGNDTNLYYILSCDLDMSAANWVPIGKSYYNDYSNGCYFAGNLNGNGHCITYSLDILDNITGDPFCGLGLFGISDATITNLKVDGTLVMRAADGMAYYGGICGLFAGTMENCVSDLDITITDTASCNYSHIGGLAGDICGVAVKNCAYTGNIYSYAPHIGCYIGGITGFVSNGAASASETSVQTVAAAAQTGDETPILLYVVILIVSAGGLSYMAIRKRKSRS